MLNSITIPSTSMDYERLCVHTFNFKKGVNILVGTNGSGKSTLYKIIQLISRDRYNEDVEYDGVLKNNVYSVASVQNNYTGIGQPNTPFEIVRLMQAKHVSEGQQGMMVLDDFMYFLNTKARQLPKNTIILIDEIDSGLSHDNLQKLGVWIETIAKEMPNMQFIFTVNNWALLSVIHNKNVIDVTTGQTVHLTNIHSFDSLMLETFDRCVERDRKYGEDATRGRMADKCLGQWQFSPFSPPPEGEYED